MRCPLIPRWLVLFAMLLAGVPAHNPALAQTNPLQQLGNFTTPQRQEIIAIPAPQVRSLAMSQPVPL